MNIKKTAQQFTNGILVIAVGIIFLNQIFAQTQNQPTNQKLFDLNQPYQSQSIQQPQPNNSANASQNPIRIRIGIASKNWAATDQQVIGAAGKLKEMLAGANSDIYDAVILQAKLDKAIVDEARKENCNYILYIEEFTSDIGSNKGGNFLSRAVTNVVKSTAESASRAIINNSPFPASGVQQVANTTLSTAVNQVNISQILQEVSNNTKKKNKVSMTYTLFGLGENNNLLTNIIKTQTATRDKESILERVLIDVGNEVLNKIPDPIQTLLPSNSNSNSLSPNTNGSFSNSNINSAQFDYQNNNTFSQTNQSQPKTAGSQNLNSTGNSFVNNSSVTIQGFYLGMSFDEAKNILNLGNAKYSPNSFGYQELNNKTNCKFLDGKLVEFSVVYEGVNWKNITEFNNAFSTPLGLPNNWKVDNYLGSSSKLDLTNYEIYSQIRSNSAYVRIKNKSWISVYEKRKDNEKITRQTEANKINDGKKSVWKP